MSAPKKVVLAYSGGLDTSIILKWLQTEYGCEVVTFTADLGQGEELEPARKKAEMLGVSEVYIEDLREEFTFRLTQELQEVEEEINDAVRALAREQGFDLLLRSPVVYASERIDITDEVLSQLQQDFERQQAAQN